MHAAAHGLIDVANRRLVVTGNQELELRSVGKEILVHQARRDVIPTRDRLDLGFVPASALLCLSCRYKARTAQSCQIGGVPVRARFHEGVHGSVGGIVAKHRGDHVHEYRLAVCTGAVQEKQCVGADVACQAVTHYTLQVVLQLVITPCDVDQEISPDRAIPLRAGRGHLGHAALAVMRTTRTSAKIHDATRRIEKPDA